MGSKYQHGVVVSCRRERSSGRSGGDSSLRGRKKAKYVSGGGWRLDKECCIPSPLEASLLSSLLSSPLFPSSPQRGQQEPKRILSWETCLPIGPMYKTKLNGTRVSKTRNNYAYLQFLDNGINIMISLPCIKHSRNHLVHLGCNG